MSAFQQLVSSILTIQLSRQQLNAFEIFERELLEWNQKYNLTAIKDPENIRTKHFLDSLTCVMAWNGDIPHSLIDVGTGAGFPGIPLKILYPAMRLTLVESVGKKLNFCKHLVQQLKLSDVDFLYARAEEVGQLPNHREKYEWAVARAVASLPVLVEYLLPLVQMGGAMLAQKGQSGVAESHSAGNAINILGGKIRKLIPITLPGIVEERFLIIVDKIAPSPSGYPRLTGIPMKKPL
jgi:16S rRNA (guanine527-N7)-methyltransferase